MHGPGGHESTRNITGNVGRSASVITTRRFTTLKPCDFTDKLYVPGNKSSVAIPLLLVCNTLAVSDDVVAATETSAPATTAPDSSFTSTIAVTLLWANTREHILAVETSSKSEIVFTLAVYSRRDWRQDGCSLSHSTKKPESTTRAVCIPIPGRQSHRNDFRNQAGTLTDVGLRRCATFLNPANPALENLFRS